MKYRKGQKISEPLSLLGLGCMRLPVIGEDRSNIDEDQCKNIFNTAINSGINYFDTAYLYHKGYSENMIGQYVSKVNRNKVHIATKMPWWLCKNLDDCERIFNEQLHRLKSEYIDIYLLHGLNIKSWNTIKDSFIIEFIHKKKKEGRIRYIGFSFHDNHDAFIEIVSNGIWDLCQVQSNIADIYFEATIEGIKFAYDMGLDVIIMEPLRGGKLITNLSDEIASIYQKTLPQYSPLEWCFRWLYNLPYVTTILSGMSSVEQIEQNIQIFESAEANCLSGDEVKALKTICKLFNSSNKIKCTECYYCNICPNNVNIVEIFRYYNSIIESDNVFINKLKYKRILSKGMLCECTKCGKCKDICPQKIDIPERIKEVINYSEFHYGHN